MNEKNKFLGGIILFLILTMMLLFCIFVIKPRINQQRDNLQAIDMGERCMNFPTCIINYKDGIIYNGYCPSEEIVKIGSFEQTVNGCIDFINLDYDLLKEDLKVSKFYSKGVIDSEKIRKYINKKGYFFVNNPDSQITLNGDIQLEGKGNGYGCSFLFCGSYPMNLDLNGKINLVGEIKAPISFVDENRLNQLGEGDDFVKCYLHIFDAYTIYNQPLQKLICGIEKNNIFVVAEIESIEEDVMACSIVDLKMYTDGYEFKNLQINPKDDCSKIWSGE